MHSNNNSDLATTVLCRKKVAMASIDSTNESLPVRLILPRYVFLNTLNADVATPASRPHPKLERPPSGANEPHPLTTTTSRFAFASEEELSKRLKELLQPTQPNHSLGTKQHPTVDGNYYSYFVANCSRIS